MVLSYGNDSFEAYYMYQTVDYSTISNLNSDLHRISFRSGHYRVNEKRAVRVVFDYLPTYKRLRSREFVDIVKQLIDWCEENIGPRGESWAAKVVENYTAFFFNDESDAVTFKLLHSEAIQK
jgi:hypothetical protein